MLLPTLADMVDACPPRVKHESPTSTSPERWACSAIILYHSMPPDPLGSVLLSYAIVLFFVISGFLYKDEYSQKPFQFIWKRFKRLYIPYVGWGLFYLALHNVFFRLQLYSEVTGFQGVPVPPLGLPDHAYKAVRILAFSGLEQMGGALWFLPTLFLADALFALISWGASRVDGKAAAVVRYGVVAIVFWTGYTSMLQVPNPWIGSRELVAVGIVCLGYCVRLVEPRLVWRWYWALVAVAFLVMAGPAVDFAGSLNWLIFRHSNPRNLFPQPLGRNTKISQFDLPTLFRLSGVNFEFHNRTTAYHNYCSLLKELAKEALNSNWPYSVEMLLFTAAPQVIIEDICNNTKVNINIK